MGCSRIQAGLSTMEQRQKMTHLARKLAVAEDKTYIIYEKENESFVDRLDEWDGSGTIETVIEP